MVQFSTIVTNYYNDQLKEDMKREEKIENGEMTRAQAIKEDEEWQEVREVTGCVVVVLMARRDARVERPLLKSEQWRCMPSLLCVVCIFHFGEHLFAERYRCYLHCYCDVLPST